MTGDTLLSLREKAACLAGGHDRGNLADQAASIVSDAYDLGLRHAGEALATVLTDLIDTDQLHSPGVLTELAKLLLPGQQEAVSRAAADLKHLAETDHGTFEAELDARIARFGDRVRSGSPEGREEMARFLRAAFADPEANGEGT
jgi:hypothetical protein